MAKEVRFSNDAKSMLYAPTLKKEDINYSDELRHCIKCKKELQQLILNLKIKQLNELRKMVKLVQSLDKLLMEPVVYVILKNIYLLVIMMSMIMNENLKMKN